MVRFRIQKGLVLCVSISVILIHFIIRHVFNVAHDLSRSDYANHRFPTANRNFKINDTLILHSKCLCQKEIVTIHNYESYYSVVVHNVHDPETRSANNMFSYNLTRVQFEGLLVTCDLYKVLRRGPGQNVIAYAIKEGEDLDAFRNVFILNVKNTVNRHFKNWVARVYYDRRQFEQTDVCGIECSNLNGVNDPTNNVDFCDVTSLPFDLKTKWDASFMPALIRRFLPIGDEFVDIFLSRDIESCSYDRELAAVDEWIQSKTLFHTMRDHYSHKSAITPGLWGARTHANRVIAKGLFHIIVENSYIYQLLDQKVWPIFKLNSTVHDSYHCESFPGSHPFPTQRKHVNCYVGMYGCCGSVMNKNLLTMECPLSCRPLSYKNWKFC